MQATASQSLSQQRKTSPIVAGLGAAVVSLGITFAIMNSNSSAMTDSGQTASTTPQCALMKRELLLSTTSDKGGTVRLRAGSYISPPIILTYAPQSVVFPLPRSTTVPVEEDLVIEGNGTGVVTTSPLTGYRRVFDAVAGAIPFNVKWQQFKGC